MKQNLRIAELQFAVEFALQSMEYTGQSSARVQTVPDTRAIRYYTTLGILERPAEMKGRTAFYDKRHVLQLVAIKRLQAQGKTLGDIQTELTGLSKRKLGGIAKLPTGFWASLEKQLSKNPVKAKAKEPKVREFELSRSDLSGKVERSQTKSRKRSKTRSALIHEQPESGNFWARPVAGDLERQTTSSVRIEITNETRISFENGFSVIVPVSTEEVTDEFIEEILPKVEKLVSEMTQILRRQQAN